MGADVMVISAHPDDAELGMGGMIHALSSAGREVVLVDVTDGEPTPHGSREIRARESAEAAAILGVARRVTLDLPNREVLDTIENRKKVAAVIREYAPEVLFLPYWEDSHPDHISTERLASAARFYSKFVKSDLPHAPHHPRRVLHCYSVHMHVKIEPAFVFDISAHFEKKMESIAAYRSQFSESHNKHVFERVASVCAYWGEQVGCRYGEPFACREPIRMVNCAAVLDA